MSRTTKLSLIAVVGLMMLVATGCQMVRVQDQHGNPVNWAAVTTGPEGKKASSLPVMTNILGDAALPKSMSDKREILQVSKDGYETKTLPRPTEDQVTVKLEKIGTAAPAKKAPAPAAKPSGYKRPASSNVKIPATGGKTTTADKKQP
ncbi:MAG: hypothetical protein KAR11_06840 [Phycisphaerae bacterium]|nr:hypothetical protein [Phycisphaerae bacterium]